MCGLSEIERQEFHKKSLDNKEDNSSFAKCRYCDNFPIDFCFVTRNGGIRCIPRCAEHYDLKKIYQ